MARFPDRDAEIRSLGEKIIAGLTAGAVDFPAPPFPSTYLQPLLDSFVSLCDEQVAAKAAAEQATTAKQAARERLIAAMRADLRYAEDTVSRNDAKLTALGWGAKAAPKPLEAPGQCGSLEALRQGEDWIALKWIKPGDGGAVAAYRIERRQRPGGVWAIVGMAVECGVTLAGQPRGTDWEYRVIAINKAGESPPSNSVAAVL
ncbi:MAG: hypothetical protein A2Z25_01280 [Planctomycetes bacterium RBG_16_55_9]|nr:MAG: hypothetical protein A2Z25_01280 [Planctomycetes bacterium RBG_16_55_9]